jgi:hypothetical protein
MKKLKKLKEQTTEQEKEEGYHKFLPLLSDYLILLLKIVVESKKISLLALGTSRYVYLTRQ